MNVLRLRVDTETDLDEPAALDGTFPDHDIIKWHTIIYHIPRYHACLQDEAVYTMTVQGG